MHHHRFVQSILTVCLILTASVATSDDRQKFLRFLGQGWGPGYHAYPPQYGQQRGQCYTDRYSRPNFSGCNAGICGYNNYLQSNENPQSFPHYSAPLYVNPHAAAPMQSTPMPQPFQRVPALDEKLPSPSHALPTNRGLPKNRIAPQDRLSPQIRFNTPELPQVDLPPEGDQRPKEKQSQPLPRLPDPKSDRRPPNNSGTAENPFGISTSYLLPRQNFSRGRPVNPLQIQSMNELREQQNPDVSTTPRTTLRKVESLPKSNTFNGIR